MEPKPKVYLETTIASYLTARESRDLIRAAHQEITRGWWDGRHAYDLFVSQLVLDEARAGDGDAAERRLTVLRGVGVLDLTDEATSLAQQLLLAGGLPQKAAIDALHIAISAVHGLDYLLTWNCTHIANARTRGLIDRTCRAAGFQPPVICTPLELQEN